MKTEDCICVPTCSEEERGNTPDCDACPVCTPDEDIEEPVIEEPDHWPEDAEAYPPIRGGEED